MGFTLANREPSPATLNTSKPQYGSPEDFAKAIEELKETFPDEGAVSTDPEDVYHHGFSLNDYHPGALVCHLIVLNLD